MSISFDNSIFDSRVILSKPLSWYVFLKSWKILENRSKDKGNVGNNVK
jgi:hypothetical protein